MWSDKSHFFLPDLRRRPIVELNCRADLSYSDRGPSTSSSELRCSTSLERPLKVCGDSERELALARAKGPACPSWFSFPSPSRWAWNVEVCCSTERKLSCTLSNWRERSLKSWWVSKPMNNVVLEFSVLYLLHVGLKQQLWPDGLTAAPRSVADVSVTPG